MKPTKITWIGFLVTLSALTIPSKTIAHNKPVSEDKFPSIESRLTRIAKVLQQKENELSSKDDINKPLQIAGGWGKGPRGGFANRSGGGGFVNRAGGGGFLNKRGWKDGGGFFNRRY